MKPIDNSTRPFAWDDEAAVEPRFRRIEQGVPPNGRVRRSGPGMPLEMPDPDGDDPACLGGAGFGGPRSGEPRGRWWRPESRVGRVFLGLCALIVLGGLATGGFLLKTYIDSDARFRIAGTGNIEAAGLTQVTRAEMLPVFGEDIGRNIFHVDLAERRGQLEEIPWVERATVMRLLPDRIRVDVVERQPVAFTRQGQQIGLVDASGVLLAMSAATMAQHHYSFPVLTGIDSRDPLPSRKARMALYQRLLAELDANGQHISEQISEIDLTDPEDARVFMPEQGADILAHFGEDRFLERYQRYKAHIAEWRQQYPKLAAVDLRYDRQVVLEMAHGANAVEAAAGAETASDSGGGKPPAGQIADNGQVAGGSAEKQISAAKAPADSADAAAMDTTAKDTALRVSTAKSQSAKNKAASDKKKRAQARRAALNGSKRKPVPPTRPAAAGPEGE
jgi:cell division protein FtsQ